MRQYRGFTAIGGMHLSKLPQALFDNLSLFYNDRDLEIIAFMGHGDMDKKYKMEALNNRFKKSDVQDAYKRGIISKYQDGKSHYINSPLTLPINIYATQMPEKWNKIKKEDRDAIADWHYDRFLEDKRDIGLEGMQKNQKPGGPA